MKDAGNHYKLETLDNGVIAFRHVQTREILHGSVGAAKEARELYLASSGLLMNPAQTLVVFDLGLGCGAQLIASLDFINSPEALCQNLKIFSFDLEKNGLTALIEAAEHFPNIQPHLSFLNQAQTNDHVEMTTANGKTLEWTFVGGDFRDTVLQPQLKNPHLRADAIFYDFFSPASHPWLWTLELHEKLYRYSHEKTRLVTYSSATCVKAVLAAAGWFVGHTSPSGKKAKSIVAAGSFAELSDPVPAKFLKTFEASHKPFCDAESEQGKADIIAKIRSHPQFSQD